MERSSLYFRRDRHSILRSDCRRRRTPPRIVPVRFLYVCFLFGSFFGSISQVAAFAPCTVSNVVVMKTAAVTALRRSARLRGVSAVAARATVPTADEPESSSRKRQRRTKATSSGSASETAKGETKKAASKSAGKKAPAKTTGRKKKSSPSIDDGEVSCLPRTDETNILSNHTARFVMGVDEAGRGPLAGPVVAAAAIVPVNIDGITDSKKITKEKDRETLYEAIVKSKDVRWAVAVMDAPFIDKVNILQATMRGMSAAASALVDETSDMIELGEEKIPVVPTLTIEQKGCYVITNRNKVGDSNSNAKTATKDDDSLGVEVEDYYALIDGNRVPPDMPCQSHSIVKGDGKEYAIAAASILAKVSRDRLMRDYHQLWPHFGLEQHKGYPTAAHMQAVKTHGASPIHRRTFRPLKDMTFDKDGKVVE